MWWWQGVAPETSRSSSSESRDADQMLTVVYAEWTIAVLLTIAAVVCFVRNRRASFLFLPPLGVAFVAALHGTCFINEGSGDPEGFIAFSVSDNGRDADGNERNYRLDGVSRVWSAVKRRGRHIVHSNEPVSQKCLLDLGNSDRPRNENV